MCVCVGGGGGHKGYNVGGHVEYNLGGLVGYNVLRKTARPCVFRSYTVRQRCYRLVCSADATLTAGHYSILFTLNHHKKWCESC